VEAFPLLANPCPILGAIGRSNKMEEHKDIPKFVSYLQECDYENRYITKLKYGLRYVLTQKSMEEIKAGISHLPFAKSVSEDLKTLYGPDVAKLALSGLRRYRDYLIHESIIEDELMLRTEGYFGEVEKAVRTYIDKERNYCRSHGERILKEYERLVSYLTSIGKTDFSNVDKTDIFNHITIRKHGRSLAVTMRVLLKFLFRHGHLPDDYSPLILCTRQKDNEVKKFHSAEDIERLLSAIDRTTISGKRAYAFFLLMARLSFRGSELLRMKIDHINWYEGHIFIKGKHDKETTLPFSKEIGEALMDYLEHSNRLSLDNLFVSLKPPYTTLTRTTKLNDVLHNLYKKTGIPCPTSYVGINVFRHSLATDRLNAGHSIQAVQTLMRHDNVATTMIYAKYNLPSLRNLATPWPEVA